MDEQIFIERILENESLTGDLEDEPATRLLQWGTRQVRPLVQDLDDEELAGAKVNTLMAVLRRLNRLAANGATTPAADLAADLRQLVELYAEAFDRARTLSPADLETAAAEAAATLAALPPIPALDFLLDWLNHTV